MKDRSSDGTPDEEGPLNRVPKSQHKEVFGDVKGTITDAVRYHFVPKTKSAGAGVRRSLAAIFTRSGSEPAFILRIT